MKHWKHFFGVVVTAIAFVVLIGFSAAPALAASATPAIPVGGTSNWGPSPIVCSMSTWYAYTGTDHHLNIKDSSQGGNLFTFSDTAASSPSVACGDGGIYFAWLANDSSHSIHVGHWITAPCSGYCHLQGTTIPGQTTSLTPAIGYSNGLVYVAWRGLGNFNISIEESYGGLSWGVYTVLHAQSVDAPALTSDGTSLYIGWPGTDSGHHLNLGQYSDGQSTLNQVVTLGSDSTLFGFGINTYEAFQPITSIKVVWKGSNNQSVNVGFYDIVKRSWISYGPLGTGNKTNVAPAVDVLGNVYYTQPNGQIASLS